MPTAVLAVAGGHHVGTDPAPREVSVVAGSRRLGHWGPGIPRRGYADPELDDELAARAAMARTPSTTTPVYPSRTREPTQ